MRALERAEKLARATSKHKVREPRSANTERVKPDAPINSAATPAEMSPSEECATEDVSDTLDDMEPEPTVAELDAIDPVVHSDESSLFESLSKLEDKLASMATAHERERESVRIELRKLQAQATCRSDE